CPLGAHRRWYPPPHACAPSEYQAVTRPPSPRSRPPGIGAGTSRTDTTRGPLLVRRPSIGRARAHRPDGSGRTGAARPAETRTAAGIDRRPEVAGRSADVALETGRQARFERAVGDHALLDVGQVPAVDDAVEALGAAHHDAGLAADHHVGGQFPGGLGESGAVEEFDDAVAVGQQQFDDLVVAVDADPPEAGLAQVGAVVLALVVEEPTARLPGQVVAAVVGDHDLLTEAVVAALGIVALALTAPHADHRQQCEHGVVQIRAEPQIRGVLGQRKIRQRRNVAAAGGGGALRGVGDRLVAAARVRGGVAVPGLRTAVPGLGTAVHGFTRVLGRFGTFARETAHDSVNNR